MASESSAIGNPPLIKIISSESKSNLPYIEIDYFKLKDLRVGEHVSSPIFNVGGFDWVLDFYPRGQRLSLGSHVALYLRFLSEAKDVVAKFSFHVRDKTTGKFVLLPISRDAVAIFAGNNAGWGYENFFARYRIDDFCGEKGILVISFSIKVLTEQKVVVNYPNGLCQHIEKLLEKEETFDLTFEVEGEIIPAHRLILAARSPVFAAKLFGSMAEAKMECIKIDEMKAEVFKALLHFVYTDRLAVNESDDALSIELLQALFVAADRYDLEKLILLCVEKLGKNLTVDTVATTLVLADRHSHAKLKNKCLDFVSDPEIFSHFALTEGYFNLKQGAPSLFTELSKKVKRSSPSLDKFAKKPRTN